MTTTDQQSPDGYGVRPVKQAIYIEQAGNLLSPFHDIPLRVPNGGGELHMVVEIPRWTNAKFEISRDEELNPIIQDSTSGEPRFVKNCFPYKGYIWNYGALPQTWEDPGFVNPETKLRGDNDPLDACDISNTAAYRGEVKKVKVLGIFCLIDGEDTDWKVMVIDVKDPMASKLQDIQDVEVCFPGLLDATREWFQYYKVPDGKPVNRVGLNGQFKDKGYAEHIIDECSEAWTRLISGRSDPGTISLKNTSMPNSPGFVNRTQSNAAEIVGEFRTPEDPNAHKWYFVGREQNAHG